MKKLIKQLLKECESCIMKLLLTGSGEYKVEANVGAPQANYQESISKVTEVKYVPKKLSGGASQFADIIVRFEPLEAGSGYEFKSEIKGDAVPREYIPEPKNWRKLVSTSLAAAMIAFTTANMSAMADLNKFEAETRGEFGIGSAAQFGSADLKKAVHVNENFRRANFTAADMRESDFSGSTFNGAYLEKAVAFKANFTGADLSDTLMDRMVLNEANLTNAVLVRSVLTRSDLGGAIIEGADFSDAVLDLPQKQALCKYANGTNPITGVSTRKSLGCGNSRRNAYGSPSSPLLSAPPPKLLDRDGFCDSATGLCEAN